MNPVFVVVRSIPARKKNGFAEKTGLEGKRVHPTRLLLRSRVFRAGTLLATCS
jgi:hypothetical protein